MRTLTLLFAVGGLITGTALVAYFGFSEVAHALFAVRWTGFLTIVAFHLAVTALLGVAWYLLAPRSAPLMAFVFGRLVRDSGSEILPLSQVGGFVMGARAAALLGLPTAVAIASTIVDLTLEMLAQLGYTALGLSILSAQKPNNHLIAWAALGIVLAFLAAIGFILVQRHGFTVIENMFRRVPYRGPELSSRGWLPSNVQFTTSTAVEVRSGVLAFSTLPFGSRAVSRPGSRCISWAQSSALTR